MAKNRYEAMSDEELRELSKQKNKKNGCFSRVALAAQRELWDRKHWNTIDITEIDQYVDRDLNDLQYNG